MEALSHDQTTKEHHFMINQSHTFSFHQLYQIITHIFNKSISQLNTDVNQLKADMKDTKQEEARIRELITSEIEKVHLRHEEASSNQHMKNEKYDADIVGFLSRFEKCENAISALNGKTNGLRAGQQAQTIKVEKFTDKMLVNHDEQNLRIDLAVDDYKNKIEALSQNVDDQLDAIERNLVEIRAQSTTTIDAKIAQLQELFDKKTKKLKVQTSEIVDDI